MSEPEGMDQNVGGQAPPPPSTPSGPPPVAPPSGSAGSPDPSEPDHGEPIWTAESAPPPEKKKSHLWLWILLGVFLALIVAGAVVIGVYRSNTADVPDLRGLTVSEGVRALNDVELELGKVDYTSEVPVGLEEGQIVSQRPDAGEAGGAGYGCQRGCGREG